MSVLQNIRYKQVRPQANSTGENFNGELTFLFNVGNNEVYVPSETYLNVVLKLAQFDTVAIPPGTDAVVEMSPGTGISSSPMSCLFTNGTLQVNNVETCKVSEYPQTAFIYNTLSKSSNKMMYNDSCDPVRLLKRYATEGTLDVENVARIRAINRDLGIVTSATPTNNLHTFEIAAKVPLMVTNDEISGNTNFQYKLQIDTNWRYQLVQSSADLSANRVLPFNTTATVDGDIKIDVLDVFLNVSVYETDSVPRSVKSSVGYKELFSTTRTIGASQTSERYVITLPRNVNEVFFCLFDSRRSTVAQYSPTNLYCEALKKLKSYEIRYGKSIMPSPLYELNLSDEDGTIASRTRKNARAFKEFVHNTVDFASFESSYVGSFYDLVSWASNPVFIHRIVKPIGDMSNDLDITLTFSSQLTATPNSILYVGASFNKEMNIEYNESGLVSQVEVKEIL